MSMCFFFFIYYNHITFPQSYYVRGRLLGLSFLVATSHNAQMLIEPDHNIKWNITYTSPMNHKQDRRWNPNQETNYPLGFNKPVESTTRITRNRALTLTRNLFSHMISFGRTGIPSEIVE